MRAYACLAAILLLAATPAFAAMPEAKTLTVSGCASLDVKPDHATIDIGVDTVDKVATKAVEANATLMNKVIEAIKALGIPSTAMQTSNFSIAAQHPQLKDGYSVDYMVTLGYAVSHTLTISVDDTSKIALIIDTAVKAGANTSNSVTFDAKNRKALDDKVLADAIKDARHSAEVMAAAEGMHVGKLLSASNGGDPGPFFGVASMAPAYRTAPTTVMAGEVTLSARVSVVFALEP